MSSVSKRKREGTRTKIKNLGDHKEFLKRITKSLYYGQLPSLPCLSLPVTELSCEAWSAAQAGRSLRRLRPDAAAAVARSACVSPCALVLALLYLERLNSCNPDYLAKAHPSELFLVSLMVGSKFLQDDGEDEDVLCSEWAASGGLDLPQLKRLELEFLKAIDWKVFVSEGSFEAGLSRLERAVALRQSRLRGFSTYADVARCGALSGPARAAAAALLAAALAYLASLLALLAAAGLLAPAPTPAPAPAPAVYPYLAPHTPPLYGDLVDHKLITNNSTDFPNTDAVTHLKNDTVDIEAPAGAISVSVGKTKCCAKWKVYEASVEPVKTWHNSGALGEWDSVDAWWSKSSVLRWLYQSSTVNPMQRWLEKLDDYGNLAAEDEWSGGRSCARRWLGSGLHRVGALLVSVSDR